jgi:hypothetical protein
MNRLPIMLGIAAIGLLAFALFAFQDSPPEPQQQDPGDYGAADVPIEVHHNAFNSTFLKPDVANLYGIDRDEGLGTLVVSAYQRDTPGVGVQAQVSGTARNLIGHMRTLRFNEIREGESAYHVTTFPIEVEEQLTFAVDVVIVPTGEKHELRWQQQFWPG